MHLARQQTVLSTLTQRPETHAEGKHQFVTKIFLASVFAAWSFECLCYTRFALAIHSSLAFINIITYLHAEKLIQTQVLHIAHHVRPLLVKGRGWTRRALTWWMSRWRSAIRPWLIWIRRFIALEHGWVGMIFFCVQMISVVVAVLKYSLKGVTRVYVQVTFFWIWTFRGVLKKESIRIQFIQSNVVYSRTSCGWNWNWCWF